MIARISRSCCAVLSGSRSGYNCSRLPSCCTLGQACSSSCTSAATYCLCRPHTERRVMGVALAAAAATACGCCLQVWRWTPAWWEQQTQRSCSKQHTSQVASTCARNTPQACCSTCWAHFQQTQQRAAHSASAAPHRQWTTVHRASATSMSLTLATSAQCACPYSARPT